MFLCLVLTQRVRSSVDWCASTGPVLAGSFGNAVSFFVMCLIPTFVMNRSEQ